MVKKIKKRDGRLVAYDRSKIEAAVHKALLSVGEEDGNFARRISLKAERAILKKYSKKIPTVENIQDIVEEVLIDEDHPKVAKAYILYRQRRTEVRDQKKLVGLVDELKLSVNSLAVLKKRYLIKNERAVTIETPRQMFMRVAGAVAAADRIYDKKSDINKTREEFFSAMSRLEFLPNSPTIMNAGTKLGQLSACFVLPIEDSMESIFNTLEIMAIIHQSGGGTGFSFSKLRPKGDVVRTTKGVASGPISFMTIFDSATEVIKQGGRRRGANMGILSADHPDIFDFVTAKSKGNSLSNFNISVSVPDSFMKSMLKNSSYPLVNPRTGEVVRKIKAKELFELIVTMAWRTGDPGLIFIDEINRHNPTPKLGSMESTNPCGEQPLLPYESCNLGSINLSKVVVNGSIDWEKLRKLIGIGVHFLDNIIDVNKYPHAEIEKLTKQNRKIGLGVMGLAEMLIKLGIPYDSKKALTMASRIMRFISVQARIESEKLGKKRGSFPNFPGSIWQKRGYRHFRNATVTTIAPTGSISIIADTTSGIEPLFAVSFVRDVMEGTQLLEVNPIFEKIAMEEGFYSRELMQDISRTGSVQKIKSVPERIRKLFVTALEIDPMWHVKMQAVFQRYTDNAVSKTVNLPKDAKLDDVRKIYLAAYNMKCKGVTVYRYGSKKEQVLYSGSYLDKETAERTEHVRVGSEYAGGCPAIYCPF